MVELFSGIGDTLDLVSTTGNKQGSKEPKKGQEDGRQEGEGREGERKRKTFIC